MGFENYTGHEHPLAYNEIIQEFYAPLEPTMGDHHVLIVIGKVFPFMRQEILPAILVLDIPEEEPSLSEPQ